jgi:hypothetical protein
MPSLGFQISNRDNDLSRVESSVVSHEICPPRKHYINQNYGMYEYSYLSLLRFEYDYK